MSCGPSGRPRARAGGTSSPRFTPRAGSRASASRPRSSGRAPVLPSPRSLRSRFPRPCPSPNPSHRRLPRSQPRRRPSISTHRCASTYGPCSPSSTARTPRRCPRECSWPMPGTPTALSCEFARPSTRLPATDMEAFEQRVNSARLVAEGPAPGRVPEEVRVLIEQCHRAVVEAEAAAFEARRRERNRAIARYEEAVAAELMALADAGIDSYASFLLLTGSGGSEVGIAERIAAQAELAAARTALDAALQVPDVPTRAELEAREMHMRVRATELLGHLPGPDPASELRGLRVPGGGDVVVKMAEIAAVLRSAGLEVTDVLAGARAFVIPPPPPPPEAPRAEPVAIAPVAGRRSAWLRARRPRRCRLRRGVPRAPARGADPHTPGARSRARAPRSGRRVPMSSGSPPRISCSRSRERSRRTAVAIFSRVGCRWCSTACSTGSTRARARRRCEVFAARRRRADSRGDRRSRSDAERGERRWHARSVARPRPRLLPRRAHDRPRAGPGGGRRLRRLVPPQRQAGVPRRCSRADAVWHDPVGEPPHVGHEGVGAFWDQARAMAESIELVPSDVIVCANQAAMVFEIHVTLARRRRRPRRPRW